MVREFGEPSPHDGHRTNRKIVQLWEARAAAIRPFPRGYTESTIRARVSKWLSDLEPVYGDMMLRVKKEAIRSAPLEDLFDLIHPFAEYTGYGSPVGRWRTALKRLRKRKSSRQVSVTTPRPLASTKPSKRKPAKSQGMKPLKQRDLDNILGI